MKILLATDGREFTQSAVDVIAHRSCISNTKVRVLSVYSLFPTILTTRLFMRGNAEYYAELDVAARKSVKGGIDSTSEFWQKTIINRVKATSSARRIRM